MCKIHTGICSKRNCSMFVFLLFCVIGDWGRQNSTSSASCAKSTHKPAWGLLRSPILKSRGRELQSRLDAGQMKENEGMLSTSECHFFVKMENKKAKERPLK